MIDGVMKELMRGIKIAAEPINHRNGARNDTGAISNNVRRARACERGWWGEGTLQVNVMNTLKMLYGSREEMQHHFRRAQNNVRTCFEAICEEKLQDRRI